MCAGWHVIWHVIKYWLASRTTQYFLSKAHQFTYPVSLFVLTDFAEGAPVDALSASRHQGEADGGADDRVGSGDRQTEEGRQQVPHSRTA